jgi:hypothetical protein
MEVIFLLNEVIVIVISYFLNDRDVGCPMYGRYVHTKNFGFYVTWYNDKVVGYKKERPDEPSRAVDSDWDYAPTNISIPPF